MLFQVICNRYKNVATIITSNKPFAESVGNPYRWIKENGFVDILFVDNSLRRSSLQSLDRRTREASEFLTNRREPQQIR